MGAYDDLDPGKASQGSGAYEDLNPDAAPIGPPAPVRTREQQIRLEALNKLMVKPPDALDIAADAYTRSMIRPLQGVKTLAEGKFNEWFGGGEPATAGEYYRGGYGAQEDYLDRARESTGAAGTAAQIAGDVGSGFAGGGALSKGGQAAVAGLQGALSGASRNADDPVKAAKGAVAGGTVDAASTFMLAGLLDRFTRGARKEIETASRGGGSQTLKTEGGALYSKLDNAGVHFSGKETPELANKVNAATAGYDVSALAPMLKELNEKVANGAMTFSDIRNIQSKIAAVKAKGDPLSRKVAGEADKAIDDFFRTAKPTMPASSVGTVSPNDLDNANKLWAGSKHAAKVEGIEAAAALASKNPAADTSRAFKQYSDRFTKNPEKFNPNADEQKAIIRSIAEGSPGKEKVAQWLSHTSIGLGGLGAAGGVSGYLSPYLGGPDFSDKSGSIALPALLAAGAARAGRNTLLQSAAEAATGKVGNLVGSIMTKAGSAPNATIPRLALAKIIAAQTAARGGGNYASSFLNKEE